MVAVARANEKDVRRTIAVSTAQAYLAILTQRRGGCSRPRARPGRQREGALRVHAGVQRIGGVGNRLDEVRAAQEFTTDEVNVQTQFAALVRAREALGVFLATSVPVDTASEDTPTRMPTVNDAMNGAEKGHPRRTGAQRSDARAAERTVKRRKGRLRAVPEPHRLSVLPGAADDHAPAHGLGRRSWCSPCPSTTAGSATGNSMERSALSEEGAPGGRGDAAAGSQRRAGGVRGDPARGHRAGPGDAVPRPSPGARWTSRTSRTARARRRTSRSSTPSGRRATPTASRRSPRTRRDSARLDLLAASGHFP